MKLSLSLACLLTTTLALTAAPPSEWPQFRGPGGSGVSEGQKPPLEFGPEKNVKWKVACPSGYSSPMLVDQKLIITAFDAGKLFTIAYDRKTGKELWRAQAPAKQIEQFDKSDGSPANSTPVTDGSRIVSYFGSCGLFCYDLNGKELWRYELPCVTTKMDFGTGVSPIIADGMVFLVRDETKEPRIMAINLVDGKLVWERKRESTSAFCTPVVCETANGKQIVAAGYGKMIAYDLKTGEEVWTVRGMPSAACTTPVVVGQTLYFAGWSPGDDMKIPSFEVMLKMSGDEKLGYLTREGLSKTGMKGSFESQDTNNDGKITKDEWDKTVQFIGTARNSAFALKLGGTGDITQTHILWKKTRGLPYVPSGIVYQGQYVLVKDGGIVTSYDATTGEELFVRRLGVSSQYYASPVAANGYVYFTSLNDGVVTVMKAGSRSAEIVAKNPKLGEKIAATPAIAEDTLYLRTAGHLYAFGANK